MELSPSGHAEGIGIFRIGDAQGDVGIEFPEKPVPDLPGCAVFAFQTGQRTVIDYEIHRNRGLGDLLERNRIHGVRRADRVPDLQIPDTGNGDDGSHLGTAHIRLLQAVKFIELCDPRLLGHVRIVEIDAHDLLPDGYGAVVYFSDPDTAHIFIVINRGYQDLRTLVRISLRSRYIIKYCFKQGLQVLRLIVQIAGAGALPRGSVQERTFQLLVGRIQIHHKFQCLIHHFFRPGFSPVDLVDAHDHRELQVQRLLQDKFCLRHRPLKCIHQQDDAVDHLQDALHFAAEIGMARCIDYVDLHAVIRNGSILGQDRNASLSLNIARVHHAFLYFLILPECAALAEHSVHQGSFAVVDVGYDCYVPDIVSLYYAHLNIHLMLISHTTALL